jgi:cytochrome P450
VPGLDDLPFLNLLSPEYDRDPYGLLRDARQQCPVVSAPLGVAVLTYDHVRELLGDTRLRPAEFDLIQMQGVTAEPVIGFVSRIPQSLPAAEHARMRGLVNRVFTRRAADRARPVMRRHAEDLFATFAGRGACEFMSEFADHYPVAVMCDILGVPPEDHHRFAVWALAIGDVFSLEACRHEQAAATGYLRLAEYIEEMIEVRRSTPADDLLSELLALEEQGDRLTRQELVTLVVTLLFAGHDTTRNQLGIGLHLFARHPEHWAALREDPDLIPSAVDEILRYRATVTIVPRITIEDVEVDGTVIPCGTLVLLSTGSANHDPVVGAGPDEFDPRAERPERHLTFGGGKHHCLGANLATVELQEAIAVLAPGMEDLSLAAEPDWRPAHSLFGPRALHLRFSPSTGGHPMAVPSEKSRRWPA